MADPSDPLAPPATPDPFGFRGGPTLKGVYSPMDAWSSANDAALSRTQTFFEMRSEGVLKSLGLGTEIRSFVIPQGNPELAEPSLLNRTEQAASILPGGAIIPLARELYQSTFNEDQPQMTEEEYKKSRYYREGVPWDGAMTEQRAAALAEAFDTSTRREYFASKRPIAGFLGGLMGGAIDPINYIPVVGPGMRAAAMYNAMKAVGPTAARWLAPMAVSSFDAATNTAIAALLTRGERGRYGDDISFEATMQQIGMGAIIGAGFGAGHTAWGRFVSGRVNPDFVNAHLRIQTENRATLANVKRSLIPLNEAVDRTLHGETPDLGPNSVDAVARSNAEARAKTPDIETVVAKQISDAGRPADEAAAAAAAIRAFHETQAENLGITVEEYTARHGLPEFRGGEPSTADLVAGELRQGGRRTIELPDGRTAEIQHPYADTFRAVVGGDPTVAPGDYRMVSPFERVEGPRTIGELNITTNRGAPYATSANVSLKRSGVATALYDAAEASLGRRLVPSPLGISDEAIAFWRSRLARVDPNERQAMLAETLRMGEEAKVGKNTRKLVDRLGFIEPSEFVPTTGQTFMQSAAPLTGFPLRVEGTGPGGQVRLRDLAEALTERHMARYGRALDPADPADHAIILDSLKEDYANQRNMSDNGEAWYVEDIDEAIRITTDIIPELVVPENRELFLTLAALLSPQQKPLHNWGNAVLAMQGFLRDGTIPTRKPNGKQFGVASHTTGLQLMQHLINTRGLEQALVWVKTPHTGREMAEIRRDSGLFVAKDSLNAYLPSETNLSESKLGIYMMGPKVGDFAQNATGLDPNAITIDLWAMRSYNRLIGRLTDVPAGLAAEGALPDTPRGRAEREQVKQLFREAAEDAGISPSAMQAALWYFEQRLYRTHGIRSDSQNFSGAARAAAERHGVSDRGADRGGEAVDRGAAGGDDAQRVSEVPGEGQTFFQSARPDQVGVAFVSPNVENIDFAGAQAALGGERQRALRTASSEIDAALGITTTGHDVIGAWSDGAENSTMVVVEGADWDTMVLAAAMKGHLADQKAVLVFKEGEGDAVLYKFRVKGKLDEVHANLLEDGVAFHTLVPEEGGATVYVADLDGSSHKAVAKAAERYDTEVTHHDGRADFVGTDSPDNDPRSDRQQRDDARRAYEGVISQSPVQKGRAVWEGVHNRWGEALTPRRPNLSEGKFSDRIAELKARRKAFDADVEAATQNGSVRMVSDTNPNEAVLIGPDMSEPGKFRVTRFDEQGPSGHVTYGTMEEAVRNQFGLYHPERADARIAGETDKVFAKRVVDKRPEPETLPEKYDDYFIMDKAEIVPIEDLVSSKTAEENAQGGGNAAKRMQAAAKGELSKRDPITVERRPDGKYLIKDGNGTYTSVKGYGWKHMPVLVEQATPDTLFQPGDMKQGGGARGSIHFGDVKTVITLFKNADASTALHETGHYFLKLFRQMAEKDGAPANTVADWAIVKDWWRSNAEAVVKDSGVEGLTAADVHAVLDNGTTGDAVKDAAIDRGLHEQWARGFERYLREGQAPSPRLAGVFEQFKTWLTKIYKKALELDVDISPEIRGVFDRMLGGKETGYKLAEDDFWRPSHKTFDEVYAVAEQRQDELNDIGRGIADELEVEYRTSPGGKPKLRSKAEAKIGLKGYDSPAHITDIVRGGFVMDAPEKADAIVTRLARHFDVMDEGWKVTKAGYFDRKVLIRFDDGTVAEIQLWEPELLRAKQEGGGHLLYDEMNTHPKGSPEYVRLQEQQKVLYGAALSEADPSWEPLVAEGLANEGKVSRPNLLKRSRQASSDISPALSQTSEKLTSVQGAPGRSLANEVKTSPLETAGRPSQLEKSSGIGVPSMREGSTPASVTQPDTTRAPPEPVPEGLKEATATVGKTETPKDLAKQFGIDLATGEFDELADIEVMREAGRLTPEDEEAIKAADETAEAAEAYGNALKAALFCLV